MVPVVTVLLALAVVQTDARRRWMGRLRRRAAGLRPRGRTHSGRLGGWLVHRRASAGEIEATYRQLAGLAIAVVAYAGAEVAGGNGFIAAFVAGLAFARVASAECADVQDLTEDELLTALTFLVFGAALAAPRLSELTWQIGVYPLPRSPSCGSCRS